MHSITFLNEIGLHAIESLQSPVIQTNLLFA